MFMIVLKKNPALPVDSAIWAKNEIICSMVRIRCSQSLKDNISFISFVVPIIVPKKEEVRTRGNENPTIPKFKT